MASTPGCSTRTVYILSSSGGSRTHSIPGSKPRWSANCLPSHVAVQSQCPRQESNLQTFGFKPNRSAVGVLGRVVPGGLEPSVALCRSAAFAARRRDRECCAVDSLGFAPRFSACGAGVLLLDDEPDRIEAEAVRLELTSGQMPPPIFEIGSSSGRITSVLHFEKFRGLESNQWPPGSEPGVTTNSNYPGSRFLGRHSCECRKFGEKDLNLHHLVQSQAAYR